MKWFLLNAVGVLLVVSTVLANSVGARYDVRNDFPPRFSYDGVIPPCEKPRTMPNGRCLDLERDLKCDTPELRLFLAHYFHGMCYSHRWERRDIEYMLDD